MKKGNKLSIETRKKISDARKGYKFSDEAKLKMRLAKLGKKHPIEWRERRKRIAKANPNYGMKGKHHSEETRRKISIHNASRTKTDDRSSSWKGDKVGYSGLHRWVPKKLGKPDTCEHCKRTGLSGNAIHWANRSGKYKRSMSDWIRLCSSCHRKYDIKYGITSKY